MGLFGSSSKKTTTNITDITTVTAGASDGSLAISGENTVSFIDAGAVENAFKFASESLGLVERSASSAQRSVNEALSKNAELLSEQQSGGAANLITFALIGVGGVALVLWMRRRG